MKTQLKTKIPLLILSLTISSCALWPYKSDFDCKIPQGEHCKSLYEINKMTDEGKFDPNLKPIASTNNKCGCKRTSTSRKR